jgi:hypothetical protein
MKQSSLVVRYHLVETYLDPSTVLLLCHHSASTRLPKPTPYAVYRSLFSLSVCSTRETLLTPFVQH